MVPCLHQCKVYIVRKLRLWRVQKCNFLVSAKTAPTGTGQQTTLCLAVPYFDSNRKFQNFGANYRHGTAFAPMQCLYCKEATGVESPKTQFPSQCKNRTDRYGSTNYPCLAAPYLASNRKFQNSGLPIAMVPCLHQCNVYIKRKLRVWRSQKCNFLVSAKTAPTGTGKQTTPCLASPCLARNRNFQNFGAIYRHGTVLELMQCLYEKEATGV